MSVETAGHAGTPQLKQFLMVSIKEFPRGIEVVAKSGKSHANLKSDQVISKANSTRGLSCVHPGPGLKPQAPSEPGSASLKHQAASLKP